MTPEFTVTVDLQHRLVVYGWQCAEIKLQLLHRPTWRSRYIKWVKPRSRPCHSHGDSHSCAETCWTSKIFRCCYTMMIWHDQPFQQLLSSCGLPFQSALWCQYSEECETMRKMRLNSISTKWLDKTSCCSNFWKNVKDKEEQNMLSGLLHINVHRQRHHTETETGSILTSSWRAI